MVWLMFVEFQEALNHVSIIFDPLQVKEILFHLRNPMTKG